MTLQGLYPICDPGAYPLEEMLSVLNQSSVMLCQLRMKTAPLSLIAETAQVMRTSLRSDIKLIINDHLDIALRYGDGCHLGQSDTPLCKASPRKAGFLFGISCHTLSEAKAAVHAGADYISVGCLYSSTTKQDATPTSLETLRSIKQAVNIPVCAIGGIQPRHVAKLSQTADLIAMQSGFWGEAD